MGPHERAALERERSGLRARIRQLSVSEGRRLDEIEKRLGNDGTYPDNLRPSDPGYLPSIDG